MAVSQPFLNVLVLDDDEKILRMFQLFMKQDSRIMVSTALNGREGMEQMLKHAFDLVIVDVNMPVMGGLEFTEEVRRIWPWQEIFFCTGHYSDSLRRRALELGVKQILEKPLSRNQLEKAIMGSRSSREYLLAREHGVPVAHGGTVHILHKFRHLAAKVWRSPRTSILVPEFLSLVADGLPLEAAALLVGDGSVKRFESFVRPGHTGSADEILYCACRDRLTALSGKPWHCGENERFRLNPDSFGDAPLDMERAVYIPLMGRRQLLGIFTAIPEENISAAPGQFPALYHAAHHFSTLFQATNEIQQQAMADPLTGLFNRRFLQSELERHRLLARQGKESFGLVLLDLDRFNLWNDEHGHAFGDQILRHAARILQEAVRRSDLLIRLGGDEFVILLPQTGREGVLEVVDRIRRDLAASPLRGSGEQLHQITASIGCVVEDAELPLGSASQLLECADKAMCAAKEQGGNRFLFWEPPGGNSAGLPKQSVLIVDDDPQVLHLLRRMLENESFDITTVGSVAEAEALLCGGRRFELLLTDLSLPRQDGMDMLRIAHEKDPDMVCLVITGHVTRHSEEVLHDAGAFEVIPKPFHPSSLRAKLGEALEHRLYRIREGGEASTRIISSN